LRDMLGGLESATSRMAILDAANRELERRASESTARLASEAVQRLEVERQLREERDFMSTILQSTNALIVVFDIQGRVVRFNRACEIASGYSASEVIGRNFWDLDLIPEEDLIAVREVMPRVVERGEEVAMQNRWRHRDGSQRIFAWLNAPLRDDAGAVRYIVSTAIDVTKRWEAREALRAERDLVETLLETTPAIILVADPQGRIVRFNRAAQITSGYSLSEVEGRNVFELMLPPEELAGARQIFEKVLCEGGPQSAETAWLHRDGTRRRLSWVSSALTDGDGTVKYVIGAAIDVTARLEAEVRERERLSELAHLHRLHTAGELAAVLAHEINQPLAAIATYSAAGLQAMSERDADDAGERGLFQKIGDAAMRAGRIVHDLRAFVTRSASSAAPLDLAAAVRSAFELVGAYARQRGVEFELHEERIPPVSVDAVQVEHIMVNLLRNGVEAVAGAGMTQGKVSVGLRRDGEMAVITVSDTGPGITKEELDRIFSPFYTNKPEGLGMGLRISRSLAEANDGRLAAEPRTPGGLFHVRLPLAS
jgi:two-component system sensor kinase FixL